MKTKKKKEKQNSQQVCWICHFFTFCHTNNASIRIQKASILFIPITRRGVSPYHDIMSVIT